MTLDHEWAGLPGDRREPPDRHRRGGGPAARRRRAPVAPQRPAGLRRRPALRRRPRRRARAARRARRRRRVRPGDLLDPAAPGALVAEAVRRHGRLDAVVAVHAYSTHTPLGALDATEIDRHLLVNVRATLLLAEAFAAAFTAGSGGRLVLFSSGQRLGPMPGELAYAASKAGVENLTAQLAPLLMPGGITVNCVNPGPTDTGYAPPDVHAAVAGLFPGGRWGTPADAARLVRFLCSPEAGWITGQVIDSEGGFQRHR
ncbi:SDR family oxidoreductase [Micromonospora sp. 4G55]|nr:SDR family oxidoreductase [Micromonospora sp. 4G55]